MPRWFRADPYDVQVVDEDATERDFGRVLAKLDTMPLDPEADPKKSRWGSYGTSWVVVDHLKLGQPSVGTMFMAKNEDLASAGGRSGIAPPSLGEDQGLGKHIAFLWDKDASVLWVQRDRNAVGMTAFRDYLISRTQMTVTITPKLHENTLTRLNKLKYVKRVDMTFSRLTDGHGTRPRKGSTIQEVLDLRDRLDASTIEITVKPGRGMYLGSGVKAMLKETATLVSEGYQELRGAKVLGFTEFDDEDEADWQVIDLLRDRMHFEMEVPAGRFRNPKALMLSIKTLWDDYREEV